MKTVACIIARTNSNGLPHKVLKEVAGKMNIEHLICRIKKSLLVDNIYLCTSYNPADKVLVEIAERNGIAAYTGSENSVIDRMLDVARIEDANNLVRITGDNIFSDSVYLDLMIKHHNINKSDYTRTEFLPVGITTEVLNIEALKNIYKNMNPQNSQYLLLYTFNPLKYKVTVLIPPIEHRHPEWTLTVDTPEDWKRVEALFQQSKNELSFQEIINLIGKGNIPFYQSKGTAIVKFPAGVTLNYEAFRKEIEFRIKKSKTINITLEEYNTAYVKQVQNYR